MKKQIVKLIQDWKAIVSKDIPFEKILLFGSAIYLEGRLFKRSISDLDLIIILPDHLKTAIERRHWMCQLKKHKQNLEKDFLILLEKEGTKQQIVSIVPIKVLPILRTTFLQC